VYAKVVDSRRLVTFRSLVLEQLAKGVKVQQKPTPNRSVFERTTNHTIRIKAPNSVFALGQPLMVRT
jgi:Rrf2 family iron-sulfur cluster assembly transcriptional regulator